MTKFAGLILTSTTLSPRFSPNFCGLSGFLRKCRCSKQGFQLSDYRFGTDCDWLCDPRSLQQLLGLFGRQLLQHACLTSGCRMHHFLHHFFRLLWSHQGTPLHDAVIFSPFGTHPCHRVGRRNCLIRIQRPGNQTTACTLLQNDNSCPNIPFC